MDHRNILSLPIVLIQKIISYRNDLNTLDLICFSLTCQKFYNERDRYLIFNPETVLVKNIDDTKSKLISYRSAFERTINLRRESGLCSLVIPPSSEEDIIQSYSSAYDYVSNNINDMYKDLNQNEISKLTISNTTIVPNLSSHANIKSIEMDSDIEGSSIVLEPNCLPLNLTQLAIRLLIPSSTLNWNVFREGLKKLEVSGFDAPLRPGVLPKSLEILFIREYSFPFEENTLPQNLLDLYIGGQYNHSLRYLPQSLHSISFGSSNQLTAENVSPHFTNLPNLKSVLSFPYELLQYIPKCVENISFSDSDMGDQVIDLSTSLSPSVKRLYLTGLSNYKLEEGSIPSTVTSLTLIGCKSPITPGILPRQLKYLYVSYDIVLDYQLDLFPTTMKKLEFVYSYDYNIEPPEFMKILSNMQRDNIDTNHVEIETCEEFIRKYGLINLPPNIKSISCYPYILRRLGGDYYIFLNINNGYSDCGIINGENINKLYPIDQSSINNNEMNAEEDQQQQQNEEINEN